MQTEKALDFAVQAHYGLVNFILDTLAQVTFAVLVRIDITAALSRVGATLWTAHLASC